MNAALAGLPINDADLERMSDDDLAALEDQLQLDIELDLSLKSQFTSGRVVVGVLTIFGIVIVLMLYSRLPTQKLGRLNIPLYLGTIGLGAAGAHLLWSAVGSRARETVRWLLGYCPMLLYLGATAYRYFQRN